jgi:hypothetical protein
MEMKAEIIEVDPDFAKIVEANDGYCPCAILQNEDTKCICKEFREQTTPGPCNCGRFMKI